MTESILQGVKDVLVKTLGIESRADELEASTPLFGEMPELDSLAVLEIVTALEERFGIVVDDSDFSGDVFETLGTLSEFVKANLG